MKQSMITVRLQYYIKSAHALFLAAEVTRVFFGTDLWQVQCSPIDSGIKHNVKKYLGPEAIDWDPTWTQLTI